MAVRAEPDADQMTDQAIREVVATRNSRHKLTWLSGGMRRWPGILGSLILGALLACSSSRPAPDLNSRTQSQNSEAPVWAADSHPACEKIQAPEHIRRVEPEYPADLRRLRVQGKVVMTATLRADGVLQDIKVSSSPSPYLSKLAVEAFQRWRYKPARCGGEPIQVYITTTMTFGLY
jgi:TonB family protein